MVKDKNVTIAVIGTGYVGLTTAVLLAHSGYKVYALDVNQDRLNTIKNGRSFFYEQGINPLIASSIKSGNLIATNSYKDSIPNSSIVFSCVGTPDNPDGSSNLSYIFAAAEESAKYMKPGTIYAQKSTVTVGTGEKIIKLFDKLGVDAQYVSNPEFLREGTAILDSLWFDRIVVGGANEPAQKVIDIYKTIESKRVKIAELGGLKHNLQHTGQYFITNLSSAELIKVTANAFLALKISFANSIAKMADKTGADINEVMDVVGADKRIGRAFLNAGRGYGGGCFPKDVSGLISSASEQGVDLEIMQAATAVNESMPGYIVNKAKDSLGDLKGKKVAVLGLAFKAGTSDARRSPGVQIANLLTENGATVTAYDPQANKEAKEHLLSQVAVFDSQESAAQGADAVFIATDWPDLLNLNLSDLASIMTGNTFVDCVNSFAREYVHQAGLNYLGVGR